MEASGPAPVLGQSSGRQGGRLCARCGAERLPFGVTGSQPGQETARAARPAGLVGRGGHYRRRGPQGSARGRSQPAPPPREVLVLRYYLGLADHEIAAALGVSRGTVSSTASRALAALARQLQE